MSSKVFTLEHVGEVTVYKRKGVRRLNLRVQNGKIKVIMPKWLPYASGLSFAKNNQKWIETQLDMVPTFNFYEGQSIGKTHTLHFVQGKAISSRLTAGKITVTIPATTNVNSPEVLEATRRAVKRALKTQAEQLLPQRLDQLANNHDFQYNGLRFKAMRSRWGSCSSNKDITINTFLMMADWEEIDYVLLHELVHTKELHHGAAFWSMLSDIVPDYKIRKKNLVDLQKRITPLQ
jgi:predicted metal-dependent hydrolase